MVSAGIEAGDAMQVLEAGTELARAGATSTDVAVRAITAAVTAFGAEAGSARDISEAFFTAQKKGVTTVGELATNFNQVAGLAKSMGISFKEALAAATALTADGAKPTTEAFTQVRAAMIAVARIQSKLSKQSPLIQKALSLQNIRAVGLTKALRQANVQIKGNAGAWFELLGRNEAVQAAISLTGSQAKLVDDIMADLNDETIRAANFNSALATKNATLMQTFKELRQTIIATLVVIGEDLNETFAETAGFIGPIVSFLKDMALGIIFVTRTLGALVGSGFALIFSNILVPIEAAIIGLRAFKLAAQGNFKAAAAAALKAKGVIARGFKNIKDISKDTFDDIADDMAKTSAKMGDIFGKGGKKAGKKFGKGFKEAVDTTTEPEEAAKSLAERIAKKFESVLGSTLIKSFDTFFKAIKAGNESLIQSFIALGEAIFRSLVGALGDALIQEGAAMLVRAAAASLGILTAPLAPGLASGGALLTGAGIAMKGLVTAFAEGGLVTGPTLGLLGEAGPELITPLDEVGNIGGGPQISGGFSIILPNVNNFREAGSERVAKSAALKLLQQTQKLNRRQGRRTARAQT